MTSHIFHTSLLRTSSSLRPNTVFDDEVLAAILSSDISTLSKLATTRLSLEYRDADGMSLLHLAVAYDQPDVAKWALEIGCDPCGLDPDGGTAMVTAIRRERIAVARILIERGGSKCPSDVTKRYAAIHWAAHCGSQEVCRILCQTADIQAATASDGNAVTIAATNSHAAALKLLVENGVSVNVPDEDGNFPIHWAAVNDSVDMIDAIVNRGGELEARTGFGRTAFFAAVMFGSKADAKRLKTLGAMTDTVDNEGQTPLWWAQSQNHQELIQMCSS